MAARHTCITPLWRLQTAAQKYGIPRDSFTYLQCDLAAMESVRKFVDDFKATGRPLDALVCNAAVYLPVDKEPTFSADGYEMSVAVNHLGHFLLTNMLLDDLAKSDYKRCGTLRFRLPWRSLIWSMCTILSDSSA